MRIQVLTSTSVRNLKPLTLEPRERFNVFVGNNGQGKTNLLEAIYAVSTLRSFRTNRLTDMLAFDAGMLPDRASTSDPDDGEEARGTEHARDTEDARGTGDARGTEDARGTGDARGTE